MLLAHFAELVPEVDDVAVDGLDLRLDLHLYVIED